MELNLRPANVVRRQKLEKRRPYFVVAAACFVLALLGWGFYYTRAAHVTHRATERLKEKIDTMRAAEGRAGQTAEQMARHCRSLMSGPLIDAVNDRSFWLELLEDLNSAPAERRYLDHGIDSDFRRKTGGSGRKTAGESSPDPPPATPAPPRRRSDGTGRGRNRAGDRRVFVRGLYLFNPKQQEVVVGFFRNLVVRLFRDRSRKIRRVSSSRPRRTTREWAYPYELHLDLRKPLKLP